MKQCRRRGKEKDILEGQGNSNIATIIIEDMIIEEMIEKDISKIPEVTLITPIDPIRNLQSPLRSHITHHPSQKTTKMISQLALSRVATGNSRAIHKNMEIGIIKEVTKKITNSMMKRKMITIGMIMTTEEVVAVAIATIEAAGVATQTINKIEITNRITIHEGAIIKIIKVRVVTKMMTEIIKQITVGEDTTNLTNNHIIEMTTINMTTVDWRTNPDIIITMTDLIEEVNQHIVEEVELLQVVRIEMIIEE